MRLNNILHFDLRRQHEHIQMMCGDLELKLNDKGKKFIEFKERISKMHQGSMRVIHPFQPKMFSTGMICIFIIINNK